MSERERPQRVDHAISPMKAVRVDVSFYAEGTTEHWKHAAERIGMAGGDNDPDIATFAALPAELRAGAYYLVGSFHPTTKDPAESSAVHWHLDWSPMPEDPPPEPIADLSRRVGGYPEVLGKLGAEWPGIRDVSMRYSVIFSREDAGKTSPDALEQVTLRGNFKGPISAELPAQLEEVAWRSLIETIRP